MKKPTVAALLFGLTLTAQEYVPGPDSQPQPGVPKGKVTHHTWSTSKSFPGTTRDYWVYVPAQYDGTGPACLMIFQDGAGYASETGAWRVPVVFDNLIHQGAMPVTIAIMIDPGVTPGAQAAQQPRFNRSQGHVYIATAIGIQVCDQAGRVVGIIRHPPGPNRARNAVFGGAELNVLHATAGSRVYRRQIRRKGCFPWEPVKLPRPQL